MIWAGALFESAVKMKKGASLFQIVQTCKPAPFGGIYEQRPFGTSKRALTVFLSNRFVYGFESIQPLRNRTRYLLFHR